MTNRWTDYATVTSVTIGGIAFSNLNTTKQFIYRVTTWQPLISSSAATVFFVILHYDHLPPNVVSITQQPHDSQTDHINHTATTSFTDWSHQSQSNHIIHSLITSITQQSFLHHIAVSSACLCLLGPWSCCDFDLWPQKLMRSSLLQNATKLKVWWKYVQYSSRHRTNEAKKCTFPQVGPQPSKVPTTPTPTDPELSRACCYQGPQIHSYYSYPQISSLA